MESWRTIKKHWQVLQILFLFINVFVFLVWQGNDILCHFDPTPLLLTMVLMLLKCNLAKGKADIFHSGKACMFATLL
jgi:hypothetical protein